MLAPATMSTSSHFMYADANPGLRPGGAGPQPIFTPAKHIDRKALEGLEFLRRPARRIEVPAVGDKAVTMVENLAPPVEVSQPATRPPPGAQLPPAKCVAFGNPTPPSSIHISSPRRAVERRTPSRASTIIAADDFDDDLLCGVDVDAMVKQREASTNPSAAAMPLPSRQNPAAPQEPTPAAMSNAGPPPLDGTGLEWRCEHGCALRDCAQLAKHVEEMTPVLDAIEFELDDDDVVMSNKQRKALIKQRDEALEIMRFAERGGGGIGGGGAAGMPTPRSVPTRELSGQPSLQPPSAGPPLHQPPILTGGVPPSGVQSGGVGGSHGDGHLGGIPPGQGERHFGGMPPGPGQFSGGAQFGNGGASTSMGGGYGWDQHGGEGRQFVGGGQYDSFGQFGGGGGGGGQFEDRQWEDRPAPGEAAASIPEVNCQFVDHEIKKWSVETFEWSPRLRSALRGTFNAQDFRGMQLATINCTMAGNDCLVLMPTGGGKSLCYQLPALISSGVTVVISPLVSLIQDQLHHLGEMGIPAAVLGSAETEGMAQQQETYERLLRQPEPELKLLYLTPEKVARSGKLMSALERLHGRGMLSRIVVDEVHCISSWGHDFRKDYKALRILKDRFRTVPVVGLTATATKRVQDDCVRQLGLERCTRFFQTFNRTNIMYDVKKKGKNVVEDMKDLIAQKYVARNGKVSCGIIYCFSQKDCETVAKKLSMKSGVDRRFPKGIAAVPYHAGLDVREENQRKWSNGRVPIICATVAFGMGINKPDVRFVFHHSIPKSLEAYHQESGRAGRDGLNSECTLFYSWGDAQKAKSMLVDSAKKDNAPAAQLENNLAALNSLVGYCENEIECRRTLLLGHFNEKFDRSRCFDRRENRWMCDTCQAKAEGAAFEEKDVTDAAAAASKVVMGVCDSGASSSMTLIIDVFRGSKAQYVKAQKLEQLDGYGAGSSMKKTEVERLLRWLIMQGYLLERTTRQTHGGPYQAMITTVHANARRCRDLIEGRARARMMFAMDPKMAAYRRGEANEAARARGQVPVAPAAAKPRAGPRSKTAKATPAGSRTAASGVVGGGRLDDIDDVDQYVYGGTQPAAAAEPESEPDPADEERAEALLAALQKMRTAIAEERMRTTGRYIHEYHVARDALLQALARKPPSSEEQLRNAAENGTFGDLTNAVFIKKYARAICVTLENALAVLSGDEPPHPPPFAPPPNGDGTQPPGSGDGGDGAPPGSGDVAGAKRPPPEWQRAGQGPQPHQQHQHQHQHQRPRYE